MTVRLTPMADSVFGVKIIRSGVQDVVMTLKTPLLVWKALRRSYKLIHGRGHSYDQTLDEFCSRDRWSKSVVFVDGVRTSVMHKYMWSSPSVCCSAIVTRKLTLQESVIRKGKKYHVQSLPSNFSVTVFEDEGEALVEKSLTCGDQIPVTIKVWGSHFSDILRIMRVKFTVEDVTSESWVDVPGEVLPG